MFNVSGAIKTARHVVTANSPVLLVGTAIAGVVATGILAAQAGYKARGIVDEAQAKQVEPLKIQDKAKLTWLCYAAPAITGASTIAATVGVHAIHTKRHAALSALYAVTSSKLDDYQTKAEELLGAKKTQTITNDVAQAQVDRDSSGLNEVVITGRGSELFHDSVSGRFFDSNVSVVESAVAELNLELVQHGHVVLNDFYDQMGLKMLPHLSNLGWSKEPDSSDRITVKFGSVYTPDGRSAVSISFHPNPVASK